MEIKIAKNEKDFEKIDNFFGKIWKEEFNLDRFNKIEQYKSGKVFFVKNNEKIISAIFIYQKDGDGQIGRFGTLKEFRGKGFGRKIFDEAIKFLKKQEAKVLYVNADIKKISMYEHFGFEKIGEEEKIGNTKSIFMKKIF